MFIKTRPFSRDGFFLFFKSEFFRAKNDPKTLKLKEELPCQTLLKISFPDGAVKEFPRGTTTEDIAASISPGLKKKAIAGKWNGQLYDLRRPIDEDGSIEIVVPDIRRCIRGFTSQYSTFDGTGC